MQQRRLWSRRRNWGVPRKRRPRKIAIGGRGIYEPVEREEDVVKKIVALLWYSGVPIFRERERVPKCHHCGAFIAEPTQAGHPDLHGFIPAKKVFEGNTRALGAIPVYIECKRPKGGVMTEIQKEFIRRARQGGALAFFATSWEDVWLNFWGIGIKLAQ